MRAGMVPMATARLRGRRALNTKAACPPAR